VFCVGGIEEDTRLDLKRVVYQPANGSTGAVYITRHMVISELNIVPALAITDIPLAAAAQVDTRYND